MNDTGKGESGFSEGDRVWVLYGRGPRAWSVQERKVDLTKSFDPPRWVLFPFGSEDYAGKTRSEAVLKFRIAHPGKTLYESVEKYLDSFGMEPSRTLAELRGRLSEIPA